MQFNVTENVAAKIQTVKFNEVSVANCGPAALFNEAKLTTTPNNFLEKVQIIHEASFMHELLSSAATIHLIYGLENNNVRRREKTTKKSKHYIKESFRIEQ